MLLQTDALKNERVKSGGFGYFGNRWALQVLLLDFTSFGIAMAEDEVDLYHACLDGHMQSFVSVTTDLVRRTTSVGACNVHCKPFWLFLQPFLRTKHDGVGRCASN